MVVKKGMLCICSKRIIQESIALCDPVRLDKGKWHIEHLTVEFSTLHFICNFQTAPYAAGEEPSEPGERRGAEGLV